MKSRQKKKDLFTVDTVGAQNDSDNEFGDSEILYPFGEAENAEESENSEDDNDDEKDDDDEEEETEDKETENDIEPIEADEDNDDEQEECDYGGEKSTTHFTKLPIRTVLPYIFAL